MAMYVPNNDYLRTFGCLCYVSTLKQGCTKFQPRVDPCVFLGYPFAQKAYKVFNLTTQITLVSRDIVFHEYYFPFQHNSSPTHFPIYLPNSDPSFSPFCDVPRPISTQDNTPPS